MDKKEKLLPQLLAYAGKRKVLTYLSMGIVGISQLLALTPFLYIWAILRDVIAGDNSRIAHYGWMAVAFAVASIIVYFCGLMCSHLAAFRIAANMRKALMRHIMSLPIGFLDTLGSGKVRKWVQESTQSTETYLAHQLPDKAGMYATMLGLAVLMFLFDWRMGLLCLATVALSLIVMVSMMIGPTLKTKMGEYNKALDCMSDILFLMPPNFIPPLDINDFLFVRYIFQFCSKVIHTFFHEKRVECASLYYLSHRIEYDSNSLRDICSSVAVLRQSLMRHEHPQ